MSFLKKLFGSKKDTSGSVNPEATAARQTTQDNTDKMWKMIEATLAFYDSTACLCAFPRFRQYTEIDCVDSGSSFYMSETEAFVFYSKKYFDIQQLASGPEADNATYTCKKCGSAYDYGWSDFSIHVNRTFLKVKELKAMQIGAAAKQPIPFFVGLFGHKYPERSLFEMMALEGYTAYLKELK